MKRAMKHRYAEGREVKTFGAIDPDLDTKGTRKVEDKKPSFKEAFAANRKAGKKTFTWNGKSYTTETKEEKSSSQTKAKTGSGTASTASTSTAASSSTAPAKKESKPTTASERIAARAQEQDAGRAALAKARGEPVRYGFQDLFGLTKAGSSRAFASQAKDKEAEMARLRAKEAAARKALPGAAAEQKKIPYGFQHLLGFDSESRAVQDINYASNRRKELQGEIDRLERGSKAKGGKVKSYASGGKVKSASARADGIAKRGKTRAR